ncbi:hypothetical protein C8J57DRAFT_1360417 [Mycena rebaudengoi]|nr:hypothetical protein C8J57DRAFT_1360417 [Mycena rebaudengoi]
MGLAPPTKREILLVCFLFALVLLLFTPVTRHEFIAVPAPVFPVASTANQNDYGRLSWGTSKVPQTTIIAHVPGWTIFDRLYIFKGVVFVVSDEPHKIPDRAAMYHKGVDIEVGEEAELARLPDDRDIRIISTAEARALFGTGAQIIDGVTVRRNASYAFIYSHMMASIFVRHYYHWCAELYFGAWRTYSSLDTSISAEGNTTLPPPRRMIFNRVDAFRWRDYSTMNQWVVRSNGQPFVFDRVLLVDRSAAMPAYNYQRYQRTAAVPFGLPGSVNWWMTIRNNVVQFAGVDPAEGEGTTSNPVITYISRQEWGRRMLIQEDHEKLVRELRMLEYRYGWEVNVVVPERMTRLEQLQLAARTTILMGVHGNGLTSLLFMKPNPRSTVIEFFYPGGFAHDYEYTARALGMAHYGFWGSEAFTSPASPLPAYPEGFQGNSIPIDGEAVAELCIERLTIATEVDD